MLARADIAAAEDLRGRDRTQFGNAQLANGGFDLCERDAVLEEEREIAFDRRIARKLPVAWHPQIGFIEPLDQDLGDVYILLQLPRRRHLRMQLPEMCHRLAIQRRRR